MAVNQAPNLSRTLLQLVRMTGLKLRLKYGERTQRNTGLKPPPGWREGKECKKMQSNACLLKNPRKTRAPKNQQFPSPRELLPPQRFSVVRE